MVSEAIIYQIAFYVGALVPTGIVSRAFLYGMKSWDGGVKRYLIANIASLGIVSWIGGMGMADGGAFAGIEALLAYIIPQALWLTFDLTRYSRTT